MNKVADWILMILFYTWTVILLLAMIGFFESDNLNEAFLCIFFLPGLFAFGLKYTAKISGKGGCCNGQGCN